MKQKEKKDEPDYIKSGYLYNLTKFIHWPINSFNFSLSPFIIGIIGDRTINSALINTLRDKTIKDRDWKIEFFNSPKEIQHCHLLFITGVLDDYVKELITQLNRKTILTVADNIKGFCEIGGMVNLVGNAPNFGYEINVNAVNYSRLTVVPEFLELATVIE